MVVFPPLVLILMLCRPPKFVLTTPKYVCQRSLQRHPALPLRCNLQALQPAMRRLRRRWRTQHLRHHLRSSMRPRPSSLRPQQSAMLRLASMMRGNLRPLQPATLRTAAWLATAPSPAAAAGATAFRYPEADNKPSSTLRVREITVPGSGSTVAPAPVPVTDTQASVEQYQRCQLVGTRAATSNADMQGRVAQCLAELDARRRAGR